jgi:putative mRNA 3-end processing factor
MSFSTEYGNDEEENAAVEPESAEVLS